MQVKRLSAADEMLAYRAINRLKDETPLAIKKKLEPQYLRHFLECEKNHFLVAMVDNEPVGFVLAYQLMRIDRKQDMMLFYEIVVDEKYRNQGVGKELICCLKQICREENIMKMWVSTNRSNAAAMELYGSTGGTEDGGGDEVSFTYLPPYE